MIKQQNKSESESKERSQILVNNAPGGSIWCNCRFDHSAFLRVSRDPRLHEVNFLFV